MTKFCEDSSDYKPKRLVSMWKDITSTSVQIFSQGRIQNLDETDSIIWRLIDGELTIRELSCKTNLQEEKIVNAIINWKKQGIAILNSSPLSPTDELSDRILIDGASLHHNVDVLFVVPPSPHANTRVNPTSNLHPLGIGYLMSVIERQSIYQCEALNLWNMNINEATIEYVLRVTNPKILGLSVMTDNYQNGVLIANIAKKVLPNTFIFMGGPHATFRGEEILASETNVDYILYGESELNIVPFLNAVLIGGGISSEIRGVIFRKNGEICRGANTDLITTLDDLPYPNRGRDWFDKNDEVGIITSRGCPGRCIFCCASAMSGNKYRMRSPESVADEIRYLYERGARNISIVDDTFTVSIPRMYKILSLIQEMQLTGVRFSAESRVDVVDYDLNIFSELYKTGFRTIQFGVESGSQVILEKLNKRITVKQILTAVELASKANLTPSCTMLIGHPYETTETIRESVLFAKRLVDLGAFVFFSVVTPYPGSKIGDHPDDYRLSVLSRSYDQYSTDNPIMELPNLSREEVREAFYDATIEIAKYCLRRRRR